MAGARRYTELEAWQLCDRLRRAVWRVVRSPGVQAERSVRDQLLRAGNGPCANLAEGFGRYHPRDFAHFVRIARGSLNESIEHLTVVEGLNLAPAPQVREAIRLAHRCLGATTRLVIYLESCTPPARGRRERTRQP
jgi:four helix bundle protein